MAESAAASPASGRIAGSAQAVLVVDDDGALIEASLGACRLLGVARAEIVGRRIHRDQFTNPDSQHESEVEPDSLSVGATTVALFQVGRNRSGGAASIGFSTSRDGGRTWREGILPGLTVNTSPPGPSLRASDPVVAWDGVRGVWLGLLALMFVRLVALVIRFRSRRWAVAGVTAQV